MRTSSDKGVRAQLRVVISANSAWNILNFRQSVIEAIKASDHIPVAVSPIEPSAVTRSRALGLEWLSLAIGRSSLNPLSDLLLLTNYWRMLRKLKPAAFLGFTIKPNLYGCIAAASLGIPAIANISGLGTVFIRGGPLTQLVKSLYRFALRRAHIVFFQNPDDMTLFLANRLIRSDQARLLPGSGIDLGQFKVTPYPEGNPKLLMIARLLGDKGVREFVAAARLLRREHGDGTFQLLGPFDPFNPSAIDRRELDLWVADGLVEYLGETEDVRPFIAAASAIVLPSYREGLPRSLIEGAAMGRPLIATNVAGCRQVVEEGVTGFLCAPRDSVSLMQAMRQFMRLSRDDAEAMGFAARKVTEERFGSERVFQAYLSVLATLPRSQELEMP